MSEPSMRGAVAEIRAALEADGLDALSVDVATEDGVVELRGEVPTHAERLGAAAVAATIVPRARLRNRLTVAPSGRGYRMTDDEVAAGVAAALVQSGVDTTGVRFDIAQHVVTVRGPVCDDHTRARIRHAIAQAPGVHVLRDRTTTIPGPAQEMR